MKIVLNKAYSGFCLPDEYANDTDTDRFDESFEVRTDPDLVKYVTTHPLESDLKVVEFPDKATDYDINEYDGYETLIYVVNGKLHYA